MNRRSEVTEGSDDRYCALCDAAASAIVECDTQAILIRHGAGLVLAPCRHAARWRELTPVEQAALATKIGPAQALLETTTRQRG